MATQRQFGLALVVLAVANLAIAVTKSHHHPELAALSAVLGLVLGGLGGLVATDIAGFDPDQDNAVLGVTAVFGLVFGFGMVVTGLMLALE